MLLIALCVALYAVAAVAVDRSTERAEAREKATQAAVVAARRTATPPPVQWTRPIR